VLAGAQRTDGFEIGLAGDILPNWSVSAAYEFLNAEVVESRTTATGTVSGLLKSLQGTTPSNVPDHSGTVWTSYRFNDAWEAGGGVFFASELFTDNVEEVTLPGYARVDAVVACHRQHYDLQFNIFNLLDKTYYESGQSRSALPGVPLSAQVTLRLSF
jgi:catecholate siderophore receptor